MPVDRARRDAAAEALTAFLRGDAGRAAVGAALESLARTPRDPATEPGRDEYAEVVPYLWLGDCTRRPVTEDAWDALCRHLAFLTTDLEPRPWHDPDADDESRLVAPARRHLVWLLAAAGVAALTNWWVFAAAAAVSLVVFQVSMARHDRAADAVRRERRERLREFEPFADRDEWLAHRHRLAEFRLPNYDPARYPPPPTPRPRPAVVRVLSAVGVALVLAAAFVYVAVGSLLIWPLWVLMMSLCPRRAGGAEPPVP